jgi:hypothetical protein
MTPQVRDGLTTASGKFPEPIKGEAKAKAAKAAGADRKTVEKARVVGLSG